MKAFEPGSSFYFHRAVEMPGKPAIDLSVDPPPDLVIEVDISRNSAHRFPIFAAIGVREVWRYHSGEVTMFALSGGGYQNLDRSRFLPRLSAAAVSKFVEDSRHQAPGDWFESLKAYLTAGSLS
ncbi:MAG: Uma2 family endonuclease [Bryobacteraceae bacterium]|nr:Uma2 family endonuclease [Bryobacteraceae bacterium]